MIPLDLQVAIADKISSPIFQAAAESCAADFYSDWQATSLDETAKREELYIKQRLLIDVVQKLQDLSTPGGG